MGVLSGWYGSTIPLTPVLIGDTSQIPNISKGAFSAVMVGFAKASSIISRHWKTDEPPALKDLLGTFFCGLK